MNTATIWLNRKRFDIRSYPDADGQYTAEIAQRREAEHRAYGRILDADGDVVYETRESREPRDVVAVLLNKMQAQRLRDAAGVAV